MNLTIHFNVKKNAKYIYIFFLQIKLEIEYELRIYCNTVCYDKLKLYGISKIIYIYIYIKINLIYKYAEFHLIKM